MPELDAEAQTQLREALLAQFASIEAALELEPVTEARGSLSQRMAQVRALSAQRGVLAAFWIEEQPDGRWFVHMMDNESERIVVRPVEAQGAHRAAAIEAVAVMARESTRALLEGGPEAWAPAPPAAPPPPLPAPPPKQAPPPVASGPQVPRPLRVWAGYAGSDFAKEPAWRNGVSVGASWRGLGLAPLYAGVGYLFTPAIERTDRVAFQVQRIPFSLSAGWRTEFGPLALDGELGLILELLHRTDSPTQTNTPTLKISPLPAHTRALVAIAPRLRIELRPAPSLGLFAGGGIDVLVNKFDYMTRETPPALLLHPFPVRPVAEAGIAFYP
jgi:hypothetical protein